MRKVPSDRARTNTGDSVLIGIEFPQLSGLGSDESDLLIAHIALLYTPTVDYEYKVSGGLQQLLCSASPLNAQKEYCLSCIASY